MIERKEQKTENTWDLSGLVRNAREWEKGMKKLRREFRRASSFKGTLTTSSALHSALEYYKNVSKDAERIGNWA